MDERALGTSAGSVFPSTAREASARPDGDEPRPREPGPLRSLNEVRKLPG